MIVLINISKLSHELLKENKEANIAIDMTCGNGNDTLFLSTIAKQVYAFDIQDKAISNTLDLMKKNNIPNVNVIKESHDLFDIYISEKIDLAIYNLGYLPNGDKSIKTKTKTVINSLKKVLTQLNDLAIVVIVIYLHDLEESKTIKEFTMNLADSFDVLQYKILNKHNSPYIIKIQKV